MELVQLDSISRRESPLLYRTKYDAVAVLDDRADDPVRTPVEFVVESDPFGSKIVTVTLVDEMDAPAAQVLQSIKEHVERLVAAGELP